MMGNRRQDEPQIDNCGRRTADMGGEMFTVLLFLLFHMFKIFHNEKLKKKLYTNKNFRTKAGINLCHK